MSKKVQVIQCAREISSGGGVSGVAHELEKEFLKKKICASRYTMEEVWLINRNSGDSSYLYKKMRLLVDVLVYSIYGTIKYLYKYKKLNDKVTISHNDLMVGDIYVNHGLHRAMLFGSSSPYKMILRNPIHIFLLIREWFRFKLKVHRKIVCFCQEDANELVRMYPNAEGRIKLIPNGVDVDKFYPSLSLAKETRSKLSVADNTFLALFVGHEFERKGLTYIIEALSSVSMNVHLLVVGGGGELAIEKMKKLAVEKSVDKRVTFLGTRSDIPNLMNAADLFILPAYYETWALVGLEAMACGTPVLMTPVGGITEYLHDKENGMFIKRDSKDIAKKINLLMNDNYLLQQMSLNARQTALKYTWSNIVEQYISLINEVSEEKKVNA